MKADKPSFKRQAASCKQSMGVMINCSAPSSLQLAACGLRLRMETGQ